MREGLNRGNLTKKKSPIIFLLIGQNGCDVREKKKSGAIIFCDYYFPAGVFVLSKRPNPPIGYLSSKALDRNET